MSFHVDIDMHHERFLVPAQMSRKVYGIRYDCDMPGPSDPSKSGLIILEPAGPGSLIRRYL